MTSNGYCLIAGAGEPALAGELPGKIKYIIAADGGVELLSGIGLLPQLFVGDLDSSTSRPASCETVIRPKEKDETDMELAIREGEARGYRRFLVIGGLGGRLDHTLANIQSAHAAAARGSSVIFLGGRQNMTVISDSVIEFDPPSDGYVSVFALGGDARGVALRGLKYPLENATLTPDFPLGVSNEFKGEPACISVGSGALAVIWDNSEGGLVLPMLDKNT